LEGEFPFLPKFPGRVNQKRLAVFTRQFSVMLDAGLPLVQCLEIMGEQQDQVKFAEIISKVRTDVEGGMSLAEAMQKQPAAFDDLYVNMVAAMSFSIVWPPIWKRSSSSRPRSSRP
jgi:type IV pilus assembly protein PilC